MMQMLTTRLHWRGAVTSVLLCLCLSSAMSCAAQPSASEPAPPAPIERVEPPPAQITTELHVSPDSIANQEAHDWLDRIAQRSKSLDTLSAKLRYVTVQGLLGDEQVRFGTLLYAAPTDTQPERFSAVLDRQVIDGNQTTIDRRFIFDGRWLLDLDAQERTAARRELANEAGGLDDSLLPVPLRLDAQSIRQRYGVALITDEPVPEDDPAASLLAGAIHLRLFPKTDGPRLDLYFHRDTLMPLRGESRQRDEDVTRVDVLAPKENVPLPEDAFETALPTTPGWKTQVVPLKD